MLGKDNLEIGQQTAVQAAMLSLTDTASECVSQNRADSQPFED